jgi:hypothetical protein
MKIKYQFVRFEFMASEFWECVDNRIGNVIGAIQWHEGWGRYYFAPNAEQILIGDFLKDIVAFMDELMRRKK